MKTIQTILIFIFCAAVNLLAASGAHPDLTGRVVESDGAPVAKATVLIYSAGPKIGTSEICPYCYPDCEKKAQTDADGTFKIESLDPALIFHLLVIANGHESKMVGKVDPAKGEQKITLKPLSAEDLRSPLRISGMVIGEDGKPVAEAVISSAGVGMGDVTQWGGVGGYVEPMAVADDAGHFILFCKSNVVNMVQAIADGRGVAKQWISLKPGGDYLIRMQNGVTVTGRIVRDGRPLEGVSVGAGTTDRACGSYFDGYEATTDENGNFRILNVPPDREFVLFTTMNSLHGNAGLPNRIFTTGDSGAVNNLGELKVQPAFKVAGRIVLSDGKPIPRGTKLLLERQEAWDNTRVTLGRDGSFEFQGVPAGAVVLSLRVKGYTLAKNNPSLDWLNGDIMGRVTGDTTNLDILMEPGQWKFNREADRPAGVDDYPIDKPLSGVRL